MSLEDYPDAAPYEHNFDVYISDCIPTLLVDYDIVDLEYVVGEAQVQFEFPTLTQTPDCQAALFYQADYSDFLGGSGVLTDVNTDYGAISIATLGYFTIYTEDRSLAGETYITPVTGVASDTTNNIIQT